MFDAIGKNLANAMQAGRNIVRRIIHARGDGLDRRLGHITLENQICLSGAKPLQADLQRSQAIIDRIGHLETSVSKSKVSSPNTKRERLQVLRYAITRWRAKPKAQARNGRSKS